MDPVWILVAINIIIIYLALFIIIAAQVNLAHDEPTEWADIDPYDINTGDILGVGYRHVFGWFVTAWSSSIWSHTGIAWRDPKTNELYVLEAANYGGKYNGVFRIPFGLWMRINRRHYKAHLRLMGVDSEGRTFRTSLCPHRLNSEFAKFENIILDRFNYRWYRFLQTTPYEDLPLDTQYTCYEITIWILQHMDVFQKKYMCSSYFARDIMNRNVDMEREYIYTDPVGIVDFVTTPYIN